MFSKIVRAKARSRTKANLARHARMNSLIRHGVVLLRLLAKGLFNSGLDFSNDIEKLLVKPKNELIIASLSACMFACSSDQAFTVGAVMHDDILPSATVPVRIW